jgi:two-component system, OmpR family, sensor histidine kinase KdpD
MFSANAVRRSLRMLASAFLVAAITGLAYGLHAKSFIAGFLYLLLILPIAFQWGFLEATVASIMAVVCLDYFFTQPLLHFYMSDPQDWVALSAFESVVLIVSRLASGLRLQAIETAAHEASVDRLYTMSRELLLIDRAEPMGAQLVRLIAEVFNASAVALWSAHEARLDEAGAQQIPKGEVRAACLRESCEDDLIHGKFTRTLWLGSRAVGALCIIGGTGCRLDARTVDAIASLAAISLERQRAFLEESNAEASRQNERLRSAVLDGLAHAFKTPLAVIQAASSGLLQIEASRQLEDELIAAIQTEVQHLSDLTTQALLTAEVEDKQLKMRPEQILVKSFLQADWSRFAQGLQDHPIEIDAGVNGCEVWADPKLLQLAFSQFIDNAAKYAHPASPITLKVEIANSETVFSVHNFGSYIPPKERAKIFQRFYRTPESRYRAPGTGIGLTVAKQIAEAHRGHVWLESDPQAGTTFYLGLPHITREDR